MDEQMRNKLHGEIMNIPCNPPEPDPDALDDGATYAYKLGHRDARHAAAELVTAAAALSQPAAADAVACCWKTSDGVFHNFSPIRDAAASGAACRRMDQTFCTLHPKATP